MQSLQQTFGTKNREPCHPNDDKIIKANINVKYLFHVLKQVLEVVPALILYTVVFLHMN